MQCYRKYAYKLYNCTHCAKEFKRLINDGMKGRPFCSRECLHLWHRGDNHHVPHVKHERVCKECSTSYIIRTNKHARTSKFCTPKCYFNYNNKNGWPKQLNLFDNCRICSKEIKIFTHEIGKRNFCSRECANKGHSEFARGMNNGRYVHGKCKSRYPIGWTKNYKKTIRERDGHICKWCNKAADHTLHVHHIDYVKDNLDPNNLITLCKYCHGKMHGSLKERARWKIILSDLLKESIESQNMSTI